MVFYALAAPILAGAGLYLSAVAWGARLPPFEVPGDRLFLIIPGQAALLLGVLCGLFAFGFSLHDVYGWMSDILTMAAECEHDLETRSDCRRRYNSPAHPV